LARIGIIGSEGRMGRALVAAVAEAGAEVGGGVDMGGDVAALAAVSEVLVDFSSPEALGLNLDAAAKAGVPILVGTTGLSEPHHGLIDRCAQRVPVLQTGNTSLGVNMLAHLVREAAARLGEAWDIEIAETHHRMKVDAPSGTALLLGEAAAAGAIGFASLRGGSVAGDHSVHFLTADERLVLTHHAENRTIFARGAVKAALWLIGRPPGRYTMAEVLGL
jgi:4-hydroxy-tetrahydrodipicolinate reductase